jgi:hypothetical protein
MKYAVLAVAALIAAPAAAHPDHDEEVHNQAPADVARQHVVRMVTQSKLAPSWSKAKVQGTSERTTNGARQTVVTFTNPTEPAARHASRRHGCGRQGRFRRAVSSLRGRRTAPFGV